MRIAAARAIAYSANDNGVPVLRLKVVTGDDDPQVISECHTALLQLSPVSSLAFVARFLDAAEPSTQELAALALGGSRLPDAFDRVARRSRGSRAGSPPSWMPPKGLPALCLPIRSFVLVLVIVLVIDFRSC